MKKSKNINRDSLTLQDIKKKLRSMPEPEVSVTLLEQLLKAIPQKNTENVSAGFFRPRLGIWSLGASAAMVIILSFIFFISMSPYTPSNIMVMDLNDSVTNSPNDLNDSFIDDSNYVSYFFQRTNIQVTSSIFQGESRFFASKSMFLPFWIYLRYDNKLDDIQFSVNYNDFCLVPENAIHKA